MAAACGSSGAPDTTTTTDATGAATSTTTTAPPTTTVPTTEALDDFDPERLTEEQLDWLVGLCEAADDPAAAFDWSLVEALFASGEVSPAGPEGPAEGFVAPRSVIEAVAAASGEAEIRAALVSTCPEFDG